MKKTFCDINGCNEEAEVEQIDVCVGWLSSSTDSSGTTAYEPFEHPDVRKRDLCSQHFRMWCKATYGIFHEQKLEMVKQK